MEVIHTFKLNSIGTWNLIPLPEQLFLDLRHLLGLHLVDSILRKLLLIGEACNTREIVHDLIVGFTEGHLLFNKAVHLLFDFWVLSAVSHKLLVLNVTLFHKF